MRLVIGSKNLSSWSLRAWLVLCEGGIRFEEVVIPLARPETREQLARWSPTGRVPVLQDGETLVWDSLAIAEYVAEVAPHLWPADRAARAMARAISAEMHAGFADLRNFLPMDASARFSPPGKLLRGVAADIGRIQTLWRTARDRFGQEGPYLFGRFSIADAMFAPVVSRFVTYAIPVDAQAQAYVDTILRNPWMQTWLNDAAAEVSSQLMGTQPGRPAAPARPATPQRSSQGGPVPAQDLPIEIPARATTILPPGQPPQPGRPVRDQPRRDVRTGDQRPQDQRPGDQRAADLAFRDPIRNREQRDADPYARDTRPAAAETARSLVNPPPRATEARSYAQEPPRAVPPLPTSVAARDEPPSPAPQRPVPPSQIPPNQIPLGAAPSRSVPPAPPAAAAYLDDDPVDAARARSGRGFSWWRSTPEPSAPTPRPEAERPDLRRAEPSAPGASIGEPASVPPLATVPPLEVPAPSVAPRAPIPPLPTALHDAAPAPFDLAPGDGSNTGTWAEPAAASAFEPIAEDSRQAAVPPPSMESPSFDPQASAERLLDETPLARAGHEGNVREAGRDATDPNAQPRPVNRFAAALSAGRLAWEKRQEELNAGIGDQVARPPVRPGGIKPIGSGLNRRR